MRNLLRDAEAATLDFDNWHASLPEDYRSSIGYQLQLAPDKEAEKRKLASTMWLSAQTGLNLNDVNSRYEEVKGSWAAREQLPVDQWRDEATFQSTVRGKVTDFRNQRLLAEDLSVQARRAALWDGSGLPVENRPAMNVWKKTKAGDPGYKPDKAGRYEVTFADQYHKERDRLAPVAKVLDATWATLYDKTWTPSPVEVYDLAKSVADLPREQQNIVLAGIAERANMLTEEERDTYLQKWGKAFGRGMDAFSGAAFIRQPLRMAADAAQELGNLGAAFGMDSDGTDEWARKQRRVANVMGRLSALREEKIDPNEGDNLLEKIGLGVAGSVPGLAAAVTLTPFSLYPQMADQAYTELERSFRESGMDEDTADRYANNIAPFAGAAMTALEKVTFGFSKGPLAGVQRQLVQRLAKSAAVTRFGAALGVETLEQFGQEVAQDSAPVIFAEAARMMGADVPNQEVIDRVMQATTPETFGVSIVFALGGGGSMPQVEQTRALQALGFQPEAVEAVLAADTIPAKQAAFAAGLETATPTPEGENALTDLARGEAAAEEEENRRADIRGISRDTDGWWVNHKDGTRTKSSSAEAAVALREDLVHTRDQAVAEQAVRIADWMADKDATLTQVFDNAAQVATEEGAFVLRPGEEPLLIPMSEQASQELQLELTRLREQESDPGLVASILGDNVVVWKDGIRGDATALVESTTTRNMKGGTILTQLHERMESRFEVFIGSGRMTTDDVVRAIRQVETALGTKMLGDTFNDTELRETAIELAVADVVGRRKDGTRVKAGTLARAVKQAAMKAPEQRHALGKLGDFLRAVRAHVQATIRTAAAIVKARRSGKLKDGDEFSSFVDKLLGTDQQADFVDQVITTVEDLATSSTRAARNIDLSAFRDRARQGYSLAARKAAKRNSLRVLLTRKALTDAAMSQASWRDWYNEHQETLDEFFAEDAELFQKLLAITSQAASVKANVGLALRAYSLLKTGAPFDGKLRGEEKSGFLPAVIKNLNALRDETGIQGQKIQAYTSANEGDSGAVVVDRHIARMLFGVDTPSKAQFAKAAKVLTEIANELGWEPRQVQAALWAASIVKSGKTPESYGAYLKKLHSRGTLRERIGAVAPSSSRVHGTVGSRGRDPGRSEGSAGDGAVATSDETTVAGTLAKDGKVKDLAVLDGEDITWTKQSFSLAPRSLPEVFRPMSQDIFDQIARETDTIAAIHIDRMRVGEFAGVPLQGGMFYPSIVENLEKGVVWAFNSEGVARGVARRAAKNGGYVKLVLMQEGNVVGNRTFTTAWFNVLKESVAAKKITKAVALGELNRVRALWATHVDSKLRTGHTKAWKSLDEAFDDIVNMPQMKRASTYFKKSLTETKADGKKIAYQSLLAKKMTALGMPDPIAMVAEFEEPSFKGVPTGAVVGIIKIDPVADSDKIQTAEEAGVPAHLSYAYVLKGKPVARMMKHKVLDETFPETAGRILSQQNTDYPVGASISFSLAKATKGILFEKESGSTQVATTVGSYKTAAGKAVGVLGDDINILDYGAGLGLGADAMRQITAGAVDSLEVNPERWASDTPPTYTDSVQIQKRYDAIINLNVLNVVPRGIRDAIVRNIGDLLRDGGVAMIGARKWEDDVNRAKNATPADEDNAILITKKIKGKDAQVFQKGFSKGELVDYLQETLGNGFDVTPATKIGAVGAMVRRKEVRSFSLSTRLDGVADALTTRITDPKARREMFQAAREQVIGMAAAMRHNDSLAGPGPWLEMAQGRELLALRRAHRDALADLDEAQPTTAAEHAQKVEALKAEHDFDMEAAKQEGWDAGRRDALRQRQRVEMERLKGQGVAARLRDGSTQAKERAALVQTQLRETMEMQAKHRVEAARAAGKLSAAESRKEMLRALATLDAILMQFPAEVRGMVGGFTKLASLTTTEARERFLRDRVDKIDSVLERYLRREYTKDMRKLIERARPKGSAGDKPKGFDPDTHHLIKAVDEAMNQNRLTVDGRMLALESEIASGQLTPEQEDLKTREHELINLAGDWSEATASRMSTALAEVEDVYGTGKLAQKRRQAVERAERTRIGSALMLATGRQGLPEERQLLEQSDNAKLGVFKKVLLSLSSFEEVMRFAFGDVAEVNEIVDRERAAAYQYEDSVQELGDDINDLFTRLAGNPLAGEQLRHKLGQPSVATGNSWGTLSELQAIQALLMWRQPDGQRHMSQHAINQAWADNLASQLSPEGQEVMTFISRRYADEHAVLNPVFRAAMGVDLPQNKLYAPLTVVPQQIQPGQVVDPVTGNAMSGSSLTPPSLRTRSMVATAEPQFRDALATLIGHNRQIQHWMAHQALVRDLNVIIGNRNLLNSVEARGGEQVRQLLLKWVQVLAQGGSRDAAAGDQLTDLMRAYTGRFARMALVGRVGTLLIQSTQLAAAAATMPAGAFVTRFGKLLAGQLSWRASLDSAFIRRRVAQAPPIVQQALEGLRSEKPNVVKHAAHRLGMLISGADALFTSGTYAIVLDYQRQQLLAAGADPAEVDALAHQEAERITERVAQPTRLGTRSYFENVTTNPLAKLGWAFASEARQKLALAGWAAANSVTDPARAARVAFVVWGAGGLMAAIIRNAWRDARDDDDEEVLDEKLWGLKRMAIQTMAGPLNGVPLWGDAVEGMINAIGKQRTFNDGPMGSVANAWPAMKRLATLKTFDDKEPVEQVMRDVESFMTFFGVFNETAASATSIFHILRDSTSLIDNLSRDPEEERDVKKREASRKKREARERP